MGLSNFARRVSGSWSLDAHLEQRMRKWCRQYFGYVLCDCAAIEAVDQLGSGLEGDLGRGDPAGKFFKPLLENSLHRVGIFQQDLEHLHLVRHYKDRD